MAVYVPTDREQRREMLESVGLSLERLFDVIPAKLRLKDQVYDGLAEDGLSELEIRSRLEKLASENLSAETYDCYLGAGFYDHFQPAVIHHLINRQEFLTAYTPYQPEISQGTLQAMFEWQSYICRLTGLDVSNASLYDGASAAAEAVLMACRQTGKERVFVSEGVHPETLATIETYCHAAGIAVVRGALNDAFSADGTFPIESDVFAAFVCQSPNVYGIVENLAVFAEQAHAVSALAIASCDPISLALFKSPGEAGVDIAVGEAQPLGNAMNFGGPAVGYLAARQKFLRKMPGRIVGQTTDRDGKTAYVLTIQAREQHIRREKATSNICTSQALCATAATIYLAMLGRSGLREVAEQCVAKSYYLHDCLLETRLFQALTEKPFFREFALKAVSGLDLNRLNRQLLSENILGGLVLDGGVWLLAVTEKRDKQALDRLVSAVKQAALEQGVSV